MKMHWVQVCLTLVCVAFAGRAKAIEVNLSGAAETSDRFGYALAVGDFDCDGDDDLIAGVPGEDSSRGAINVVYSGSSGLGTPGNKSLAASSFFSASGGESFGAALATGDFDGDGCDDIAVGATGAHVGGAVIVAYGGPAGIDPGNSEMWHQDSPGIIEMSEPGDAFGLSVTSADFDGDGFDDLAIGSPFEDVGTFANSAGMVSVLYGSASGITADGDQALHQWMFSPIRVLGELESDDNFAYIMTSGDFNGDGIGDLAVGTPADHVDGLHNAGSVLILPGSPGGLTGDGSQLLTRKDLGYPNEGYLFGYGLAAGDFDGDGCDDLAAAAAAPVGGAVHVLRGTASGLSLSSEQIWTQDTPNVPGSGSQGDNFGLALVAGNFNGGSYDDLAISNPEEVVNGFDRAGAVTILYGSVTGLRVQLTRTNYITQDMTTDEQAEEFDKFGLALANGDFNGDGIDELLVGVDLEDLSGKSSAGAVHVYVGSSTGPKVDSTSQFLRQ